MLTDLPCKFDPEEYTYTITPSLTSFNFMDCPHNITLLMNSSEDIDIILGIDQMKSMIPRKQYSSTLQSLHITSTVPVHQHTVSLLSRNTNTSFSLDVQTANTTIMFSRIDMDFPVTYKIRSAAGNKVVLVRTPLPPSDHIVIEGNVTVGIQSATSMHRTECKISLVGEGNVLSENFTYLLRSNPLDASAMQPLCTRKGYSRYTDCTMEEMLETATNEQIGCTCKYLWYDSVGAHYNQWDCNEYSRFLDLVAYLPNVTVSGTWNTITVRNTNGTINAESLTTTILNGTRLQGTLKTHSLTVLNTVYIDSVQTMNLDLTNGKLYISSSKHTHLPDGFAISSEVEITGYSRVISVNSPRDEL